MKNEKPPWREKQNKLLPKCYCFCPALRSLVTWHGPALKMPARKPARPVLRAFGVSFFFVRSALKKKRTGIHKMLLYSFIFSPQIVHRKKEKQTTKNNVKVKKEKKRKNPPCPLKKTLMKMKKNERLIEKKTCSFPLLTFFDRMMIFLLNCERRKV